MTSVKHENEKLEKFSFYKLSTLFPLEHVYENYLNFNTHIMKVFILQYIDEGEQNGVLSLVWFLRALEGLPSIPLKAMD